MKTVVQGSTSAMSSRPRVNASSSFSCCPDDPRKIRGFIHSYRRNVIVTDGGRVAGIVTDRDIVIRAIAEGREARSTTVGDVCTSDARTLAPEDSVEAAAQAMAENGIRRLPVVDHGKLVGIVSLGDLAQDRDAGPPLAEISPRRRTTRRRSDAASSRLPNQVVRASVRPLGGVADPGDVAVGADQDGGRARRPRRSPAAPTGRRSSRRPTGPGPPRARCRRRRARRG